MAKVSRRKLRWVCPNCEMPCTEWHCDLKLSPNCDLELCLECGLVVGLVGSALRTYPLSDSSSPKRK